MADMTPHGVAASLLRSAHLYKVADVTPMARNIASATHIAMGDVEMVKEHVNFGFDLYSKNLFRLPFPRCFFSFKNHSVYAYEVDEFAFGLFYCQKIFESHGPCLPCYTMIFEPNNADEKTVSFSGETDLLMSGWENFPADQLEKSAAMAAAEVMWACVLMMSKSVVVETISASDRLNKARARNGKTPIRTSYRIKINTPNLRNIINMDDGSTEDITGHVRGAARMHWRRGHYRTIFQGTGRERVVPVVPTIVGAREDAMPIKKRYDVAQ